MYDTGPLQCATGRTLFPTKKKRKWGVIIISGLEILTNMPPPRRKQHLSQVNYYMQRGKAKAMVKHGPFGIVDAILFCFFYQLRNSFFFERLNNRYCPLNVHNGQRWNSFIGLCVVMSFVSR